MPIHARKRVAHEWLVDPLAQTIEVFRSDGESYRLLSTHAENETPRLEPFGAIELDLAALRGDFAQGDW